MTFGDESMKNYEKKLLGFLLSLFIFKRIMLHELNQEERI